MFGFDKLKLVMSLDDIEVINEDVYIRKEVRDELVELSYKQTEPFSLTIKIDYRQEEVVIEFTGKVLMSDYHNLIRLSNISSCIENINALGVIVIKSYRTSDVVKCDITNDYDYVNVRGLSEYIECNLSGNKKYVPRNLMNGNFVVDKNVVTNQCKKRLTIYNKFAEMNMAKNRSFLHRYYGGENPFVHKCCRFELNLNSKQQIRSSLHVSDTKLITLLLAAQSVNPIYEFLSEILCEDVVSKEVTNTVEDLKRYALLYMCNFDLSRVRAELNARKSKGTKMRAMLKPYQQMLASLNDNPNKLSRDYILNLVKTNTQITPAMICQSIS